MNRVAPVVVMLLAAARAATGQVTISPSQAAQGEFRSNVLTIDRVSIPGGRDYVGVRLRLQPNGTWTLESGGPDALARRDVRVRFAPASQTLEIPFVLGYSGSAATSMYRDVRFQLAGSVLNVIAAAQVTALQGRITSSTDGSPVAGASVWVASPGPVALSDANGRYLLAGVPAGAVTVNASAEALARIESRTVVAQAGAITTVDLSGPPRSAGGLQGTVTLGGVAVSGVRVSVRDIDAFAVAGSAVSTASGGFAIAGLRAGRYVLLAQGDVGFTARPITIVAGQTLDVSLALALADPPADTASDAAGDRVLLDAACDPRVGVLAVDLLGRNGPPFFAAANQFVNDLKAAGPSLGYTIVNKIPGFEENVAVHYLVILTTDAWTYRLVDVEIGAIIDAGEIFPLDRLDTYFRSALKARIDAHDRVTFGFGPPVALSPGSCVRLPYTVDTMQGRVTARGGRGRLLGRQIADGLYTFRVQNNQVEALAYLLPGDTAVGTPDAVTFVSACRYAPASLITALQPLILPVVSAATEIDSFRTTDDGRLRGGSFHRHAISGSWGTEVIGEGSNRFWLYPGTDRITFSDGITVTEVSVIAADSCGNDCTTVTIEGVDSAEQPRTRTVAAPNGNLGGITVNSRQQGFARVTSVELRSFEGFFRDLRVSTVPFTCTAEDLAWLRR